MRIDEFDLNGITEPLQSWFVRAGRQLPWRVKLPGQEGEGLEAPDPYRVWVSEIMLQQTRVDTVKPYYRRFVERLPDVAALAECPQDELNKLWEGLGYYSRVRNMKTAAGQVMEDYGGVMPDHFRELLKLKGIGRYTAGAIASIAYGEPVPAVDGNVLRVLSRLAADPADIAKQTVKSHIEGLLTEWMGTQSAQCEQSEQSAQCKQSERSAQCEQSERSAQCEQPVQSVQFEEKTLRKSQEPLDLSKLSIVQPRIFNQALMDLGALICVPNGEPHCAECPLGKLCLARAKGATDRIPVKSKPNRRKIEKRTVLLLRRAGRIAVRQRPDTGLLAGLYEFPNREGHQTPECVMEELAAYGAKPVSIRPLPEAKHIFSHVEWHMKGYEVELEENRTVGPGQKPDGLLFLEERELREHYAVPTAFEAYMKLL